MQENYLEHPDEDVLERFLLNQSGEEELETIETHILACDSCVSRLEALELEIAAMKLALQETRKQDAAASVAARQSSGNKWFTVPKLSMAAGLAALALGLLVVPQMRNNRAVPMAEVTLSATRGSETTLVPQDRPLHVVLNANDLNSKQLEVQLVDANGKQLWKGAATVLNNQAAVYLPKITDAGGHFINLYAPAQTQNGEPELLRQFALDVEQVKAQ
jgi:hypothetical protein